MKRRKTLTLFFLSLLSFISLLVFNNYESYCKGFLIKKCMYYVDFQGINNEGGWAGTFDSDAKKVLMKYKAEIIDIEFINESATVYLTKMQSKKIVKDENVKRIVKLEADKVRNMYP